jgi:DNA-binding transcriptional ArsR family regulator
MIDCTKVNLLKRLHKLIDRIRGAVPYRAVVTRELADLFGVLSHPHRIRIIEELREGERDVNSLAEILGISHSAASQHLALLRSHRLLAERRQGRNVFYRLRRSRLAAWLIEGLEFIAPDAQSMEELSQAVARARETWSAADSSQAG